MKAFIVVSCLILTATAKPQGYNYDKPANDGLSVTLLLPTSHQEFAPVSSHQSLGVGSHSSGGSLSLGSSYSVSPTVNTFSGNSFGGNSFGSGVSSGNSFGSDASSSFNSNSFGSGVSSGNSFGSDASSSFNSNSFGSGVSSGNSFGSDASSSFNSNSFGSGSSFSGVASQAPSSSFASVASAPNTLVQKHIYVHVPPPDDEELDLHRNAVAPVQAQKHYKIIFIKAPSGPSVAQQLAQANLAQQQSEEKTLVYVLVKKPESLAELQNAIPRAPLPPPSKPEVYFIKYKAQTGGLSAPVPVSQSIGSSAPLASAPTPDFQELSQSSSFDSPSSVSSAVGAVDATAQTLGSSSTSSFDGSSSSVLSDSDASNIAAVIQPRTPAPEYGPPKQ